MKRTPVGPDDLAGVIAVPPLPRCDDGQWTICWSEADRLVRHVQAAGITRFMFGGNAFFYHVSLSDYERALDWMAGLPDSCWILPSAGPSYGRLVDQARVLKGRGFPAVMLLPCSDPRDAAGLEVGIRRFVDQAETPVVIYLKSEDTLGADRRAGLEVLGRLSEGGLCVGIKYAVVRADPAVDEYLGELLSRVDRGRVASGIGERPAVVHLRDWGLKGFTTGSGCVAPGWTQALLEAARAGRWSEAEEIRQRFLPLEGCRDAWNPAKVLHHAVDLAGVARTGPLLPFLSSLDPARLAKVREALGPLQRPAPGRGIA